MAGYKEDDQHSVRFFLDLFAFYIGFAFSGAVWGGGLKILLITSGIWKRG